VELGADGQAKTAIAPLDRIKILFQTSNAEFRQFAGKLSLPFMLVNEKSSRDDAEPLVTRKARCARCWPERQVVTPPLQRDS
jgi:alkanesulfonate monooxygenase SsuD/methylene tetrahydromethanopterin reductase-like flavin-dependent oxidoreductase (luciferase family)